eukprot:3593695-Rhodomonas_salina.1
MLWRDGEGEKGFGAKVGWLPLALAVEASEHWCALRCPPKWGAGLTGSRGRDRGRGTWALDSRMLMKPCVGRCSSGGVANQEPTTIAHF